MFGWFRSKAECPVDPVTRDWIEWRMRWLAEQFTWERLRSGRVILPTPEFFPDPFENTADDAQVILNRVCGYMEIDPNTLLLSIYQDSEPNFEGQWRQSAAGHFREIGGKFQISIEESNLDDPLALIATIAHELGHVHLLGHRRISPETEDHEPLTDLLTVFLGMGIFTANSVIRENYWFEGGYSGWKMGKQGYLTMPMFGYAFAIYARARGEENPEWSRLLRADVRSPFKAGFRYLAERAESPGNSEDQGENEC